MSPADRRARPKWHVTVRHALSGKTRVVILPGGIQEPEARRGAAMRAGSYWCAVAAELRAAP